jgi:hypothetical protein
LLTTKTDNTVVNVELLTFSKESNKLINWLSKKKISKFVKFKKKFKKKNGIL